ncbi:MAG: ABC transporter permease [Candidatus Thiodiazotropha sp. (ex Semelilucina semeliformis)]|nr:ABC transporter permease [Candidatus Thiodiazotropha sp. (ex Semelilucina semeliformis)]
MIRRLAWVEWKRVMRTPLAWVMLSVSLCLLSWQFLGTLEAFVGIQTGDRILGLTHHLGLQLFGLAAVVLFIITPILTMRVFSEAFRSGTYTLLSSSAISVSDILLGKFFGILLLQLPFVLMPAGLSLTLTTGTTLDLGLIAAATLGLLLLSALYTAIGLYLSVLSENPAVAAAGAYGLSLLLSLLDQHTASDGFLHWLAWPSHYLNLQMGLVHSSDIAYFLLLMLFFLGLSYHQLDQRRCG